MASYSYKREMVNGHWNINNTAVVDLEGHTIPLARIIADQFPLKGIVCLEANGEEVIIKNDVGFEGADKTRLDSIKRKAEDPCPLPL